MVLQQEMTLPGLHEFLATQVLPRSRISAGMRAIDLGAGSGAWADRLTRAGFETTAVEQNVEGYRGACRLIAADMNAPDFASAAGGPYDLVTAIEVIEHLENPIEFLRNLGRLVTADGVIVLTTPNVDSAPSRAKFLLTGRLRAMDDHGDPTHISPVFLWTFVHRWLPRAGLGLVVRRSYPEGTFLIGRPAFTKAFRLLSPLLRHGPLTGDVHVMVLERRNGAGADG